MNTKLLKVIDVGLVLGIPSRGVYRLIRQRRLAAIRVGRLLRVLEGDLNTYIEEQRKRGVL